MAVSHMTKAEIRSVCRTFLDEINAESWTDNQLDELINVAYEMRWSQIVGLHRLDFVKSFDFTYPANTTSVTFDTIAVSAPANNEFDVMEWVFVEDIQDATNPVEVGYVPWMRRNEVLAASGTRVAASRRDVGYHWTYKGRELWIIRQPTSALSLRLHVVPPFKPFDVGALGDLQRPQFTLFNRILAVDAALLARESVGDDVKNLGIIQERMSVALERAYTQRNAAAPDRIHGTDADFTMGRGAV
jgi:hypothetical protein